MIHHFLRFHIYIIYLFLRMRIEGEVNLSYIVIKIAENSEAKELERAADNLAFDTTEYVSARESSNIDDVSKFERLNTRQDGEDNEDAKQRFFNTFLQLVKEKSKNNRD